MFGWKPLAAFLMAGMVAGEAAAEISANAGIVSDYRFRGISLSDRGPALQGGLDLETDIGLFAGTWASTIADYEGADVEIDVYAGYASSLGSLDYSIGAYAYLYPGGREVSYVEIGGTAEHAVGPVTVGLEASYAPRQAHVDKANHYLGASTSFEIPGTGIIAKARGGREDGFYDSKWDWEVGIAYSRSIFTGSLSYADTNRGAPDEEGRWGSGGIILSLLAQF